MRFAFVIILFLVFAAETVPFRLVMAQEAEDLDEFAKSCLPACYGPCPTVYGQIEALFMKREPRFLDQPIIVDDNTNTTLLSTSNLNYNFDPGLRATVGNRLHGGRALEFTYFGLFEGDASAAVVTPGPAGLLIFPNNLVGNVFVDMNRADVNYTSWLHSSELNLVSCCGCCDESKGKGGSGKGHDQCGSSEVSCRTFEWFAGFRYINLGEELNIAVQGPVVGEEGAYNIRTINNLYGGQLGARVRRSQDRFGWEGTGKAGLYGASARQNQSVIDFPNFPLPGRTVSSRGGTVAFVGELNLSGFYALTDVWNLRAGYTAMWIEGLALGPDQLDFNFAAVPTGISTGGGMFLHGVNVGLEARW